MKENTKYHNYKFVGKINVDENQPWFDFTTAKPWDESEIPWILDNKVRREILIQLSKGPKTFDELYKLVNFSPKPLLISKCVMYSRNIESIDLFSKLLSISFSLTSWESCTSSDV